MGQYVSGEDFPTAQSVDQNLSRNAYQHIQDNAYFLCADVQLPFRHITAIDRHYLGHSVLNNYITGVSTRGF